MAEMSVEYINPFLVSASKVVKDMCQYEVKVGKPYVKKTNFEKDSIIIMIGVTGVIRGQVMIAFGLQSAMDISSKMIMMPLTELNEIAESAICELGNMILGNAATILSTKGVEIDITPPSIVKGNLSITNNFAQNICIPLQYEEDKSFEIYVTLKQE